MHYQKKFEALDQWQKDRDTEFDQFKKDQTSHITQMATKNAEIWGASNECLSPLGMVSVCQPNRGMSPLHASLSLPLFPISLKNSLWGLCTITYDHVQTFSCIY